MLSKLEIEKRVKKVVADLALTNASAIENDEFLSHYLPVRNKGRLSRELSQEIECVEAETYMTKLYEGWKKIQEIIDGSDKECNG